MPKVYDDDQTKLKTYKNRVLSGTRKLDEWKPLAEDLLDRYRLVPRKKQYTPKGHRVSVTTGVGIIDAIYSSLTAVNVEVLVEMMAEGSVIQKKLAEKAIQEVWLEQKTNVKAAKTVKDTTIVGLGWFKVFYEYAEEDVVRKRPDEDVDSDIDTLFDEAEAAGFPPPDPQQIAELVPKVEEITEVTRDRVVHEFVAWDEVLIDTFARGADEIHWHCHEKRMTPEEVSTNASFQEYVGGVDENDDPEVRKAKMARAQRVLSEIKADIEMDPKYRGEREATDDDGRITIYEMSDLETGTVTTFAKEGDIILNEAVNPFFAINDDLIDKAMYIPLITRSNPGEVRGISDMELVAPSLDELEVYRSNLANFLERLKPKILGPASALTEEFNQAMESQEWGKYVPLEDDTQASDILPLPFPQLPQEMFGMIERIENSVREATGVNELMRGIFPDRKRTATETAEVVSASNSRQSEKRNLMEEFYSAIARKTLQLIMMFYDDERISRLAGDEYEGEEVVWEWDAESIAGDMALRVELSPKEPVNRDSRREEAFMVMNVFGILPEVDKVELARWAACHMGIDEREIARFLKTKAEMQVEQQAALQQQSAEVQAADGVAPDPASVAGPLSGEELAAQANEGELPAELMSAVAGAAPGSGEVAEIVEGE